VTCVTAPDPHNSPIAKAVRDGHLDVVRVALDAGLDPCTTDADGLPLLVLAAARGRREMVELCLNEDGTRTPPAGIASRL
jgi:ankyrin repeat protein